MGDRSVSRTPTGNRHHHELNGIIRGLNQTCGLNIPERKERHSPSPNIFPEDKCHSKLKLLFFKKPLEIDNVLTRFKQKYQISQGNPGFFAQLPQEKRTQHFLQFLDHETDQVINDLTPSRKQRVQIHSAGSVSGFTAVEIDQHAKIKPPDFRQVKTAAEHVYLDKTLVDADSEYITANETLQDSPVAEGFVTPPQPPSPSVMAQDSALRRGDRPHPTVTYPQLPAQKRRSDGEMQRQSPKHPRTTGASRDREIEGWQSANNPGDTYVRHANYREPVSAIRSFDSTTTLPDSAEVSFGSTVLNKSFMTDDTELSQGPKSSATMGSLDSEDFRNINLDGPFLQTIPHNIVSGGEIRTPTKGRADLSKTEQMTSEKGKGSVPIPYQIRDLASQNLFIKDLSQPNHKISFLHLWECTRIAQAIGESPEAIIKECSENLHVGAEFKTWARQRWSINSISLADEKVWASVDRDYENYTFQAKLSFSHKQQGPLFTIVLDPPLKDQSCRFQRRFGSDRFLYISLPATKELPHSGYTEEYENRLGDWLTTEHSFLGRKWRVVLSEPGKATKSDRLRDLRPDLRLKLFALSGSGLTQSRDEQRERSKDGICPPGRSEMTLDELINWFLPMRHPYNSKQKFCKAFARLELGFSRGCPLLPMKPSQIHFVDDIRANGEGEDTRHNDKRLDWTGVPNPSMEMNDGCERMSAEAAKQIWMNARNDPGKPGLGDSIPSAFQGRIGGAKGMWIVEPDDHSGEVWIRINKSQLKFKCHPMDLDDRTYDQHRLTFEIVGFSAPLRSAALTLGLLPIFIDRGVKEESVRRALKACLEHEQKVILGLFNPEDCPKRIRKWVHDQARTKGDEQNIAHQGSQPWSLSERLILLLESGFNPCEFKYAAELVARTVSKHLLTTAQYLRLPVEKSTNVYGIADPYGVLKPGEIFLQFSKQFCDEQTGEYFTTLRGLDLLVTRSPTLRRSDIQRVKGVYKERLRHIFNVVVFPSRGRHALANKLQGGDYDGDTFWVCWEPEFTGSFLNAPAPVRTPGPSELKIDVEGRTLAQVMQRKGSAAHHFIKEGLQFRMKRSFLGEVTNAHSKVCYNEGTIHAPIITELSNIHEYLIDSSKNGYIYTQEKYADLLEHIRASSFSKNPLREAEHKVVMKEIAKAFSASKSEEKLQSLVESRRPRKKGIADELLFDLMLPKIKSIIDLIRAKVVDSSSPDDCDLKDPYATRRRRALASSKDPHLVMEIEQLKIKLDKPYQTWSSAWNRRQDMKQETYDDTVNKCYAEYQAISPLDPDHPVVWEWMQPGAAGLPSTWSLMKASALFDRRFEKDSFVFHMAGYELADIKASASGRSRKMIFEMWRSMKPRKLAETHRDLDEPFVLNQAIVDHEDDASSIGFDDNLY